MPSSIKFRAEWDNSQTLRWETQTKNSVKSVQDSIKSYLGGKLTQVFSVSAIEETVRRTGEWADELKRSAQELNINTEEMQALQLVAKRAHVDIGAVTGYYKRMADAAKEALNGNVMLRSSLRNLGIEGKALQTSTGAQMFNMMTKKVGNQPGAFSADLQRVFGEEQLPNLGAMMGAMGGKTPQEYAGANKGQIVTNKDIEELDALWHETLDALKRAGVKLIWIPKLILEMVAGFSRAANGVITLVEMLTKGLYHNLIGRFTGKQGKQDMYDFNARASKTFKGMVGLQNPLGMTEQEYQESRDLRALGVEAASTLVGGPIAKKVGEIGGKYATKKFTQRFLKTDRAKEMVEAEIKAAQEAHAKISPLSPITELQQGFEHQKILKNMMASKEVKAIESKVMNTTKYIEKGALSTVSALGAYGGSVAAGQENTITPQKLGVNRLLDINPAAFAGGGVSGGGGNLKIGGVFGTDLSMQIINLNSQMVDLLQRLVQNTDKNPGDYTKSQLGNN